MELPSKKPEKIKLVEINPYLTCYLCKGYLIDATTISECLHSFCRSCIIRFLQENSYCPVCEVIINKAKPNLKLDKTLQDIVYKLVPELFLKEMTRRKQFYQQHPDISAKVSPEERGEDTERTIFNPQDLISLSLEYVSDDSVPGAIKLPESIKLCDKDKYSNLANESTESQMKRYLQCSGMCRIEVLKKFVRNKYNVDTNLFYIDILYKRVPLPDHYTLIDIAYIYSWKRNEPMKFFFRIVDINKEPDPYEFFTTPSFINSIPKATTVRQHRNSSEKVANRKQRDSFLNVHNKKLCKVAKIGKPKVCDINISGEKNGDNKTNNELDNSVTNNSSDELNHVHCKKDKQKGVRFAETPPVIINSELKADNNVLESKVSEQKELIKSGEQTSPNNNNKVYTNITLNRTNNVEIITKIETVSNKDGQEIGVNIFKQIKKSGANNNKRQGSVSPSEKRESVDNLRNDKDKNEKSVGGGDDDEVVEDEKSKFLKSFELTAKTTVQNVAAKQCEQIKPSGGQKRKNSSPVKNDKTKKVKLNKSASTKVILQPKKKSDQTGDSNKMNNGLQSLISSCNINIPSSLSITIKDSNAPHSPVQIPPVQNYIEILKLPDENKDSSIIENKSNAESNTETPTNKFALTMATDAVSNSSSEDSEQKVDQDLCEIAKSLTEKLPNVPQIDTKAQFPAPKFTIQPAPVPELPCKMFNLPKDSLVKLNPRSPQTFQKIFEESIKKGTGPTNDTPNTTNNKRNILEIAKQLYKKTKLEQEKSLTETKKDDMPATVPAPVPKVPIPRLPHQRTLKQTQQPKIIPSPENNQVKFPQTIANLHSSSLGLNYTVSVGQNNATNTVHQPKVNGILSPVKIASKETTLSVECEIDNKNEPLKSSPTLAAKQTELKLDLSVLDAKPVGKNDQLAKNQSPNIGHKSPKHSPKSSPVVKHMYSPTVDPARGFNLPKQIPSPNSNSSHTGNLVIKTSPNSLSPAKSPASTSPTKKSPKLANACNNNKQAKQSASPSSPLNSNQLLEKYNIQNLAQLTASLNFNPAATFGLNPTSQMAIHQAMLLMQNRQNWLNMNQGPLLQYEKFLQSLNPNQNQLLSNIKEN